MSKRKYEGPTRAGLLAYVRWLADDDFMELTDEAREARRWSLQFDTGPFSEWSDFVEFAESLAYSPWNWTP